MANITHLNLKKDYRAKGLQSLFDLIKSELPDLEKRLLAVKRTPNDSYSDNYIRGQIVAYQKTLDLLKVLLNDNPN